MKNKLLIFTFLLVGFVARLSSQPGIIKQVKLTDFDLQSSALISATGEELSGPDYKSNVYWFPVKVPSTVLTGLVANGVYPDPYIGTEQYAYS